MLRKINTWTLAFILIAIAASTTLTDTTLNRNAFYLATLFSIIALFIHRPKGIPHDVKLVSLGLLIIGLSQLLWHWRFPLAADSRFEADKEYFTTALRLISGAALIFSMGSLRNNEGTKTRITINILIIIGFLYTSCIGLYYHLKSPDARLEIKTVATMTAYIYMLQSLLTIHVISSLNLRYKRLAITAVILLTLWVILLTETRSSLLLYPIILLLLFCRRHHLSIKMMLISCLVGLLVGSTIYYFFQNTAGRLAESVTELSNYQKGDGNSSLGSRISMWKAGVNVIKHHPYGQTTANRLTTTTEYIDQHEGGNPEALRNLVFHLHNDLIEAGSLQGISGITVLLLFYILVFYASRISGAARPTALLVLLPTMVIGMVDTLFIDHRYVTNLALLLTIYLCLPPSACNNTYSNAR